MFQIFSGVVHLRRFMLLAVSRVRIWVIAMSLRGDEVKAEN
jgi:hypothetical protein